MLSFDITKLKETVTGQSLNFLLHFLKLEHNMSAEH